MDEEAPRRGSVLLRGDRIEYVGPTASLPSAPNAHVVDGSGRFLIPGLIDMHTHVSKTRVVSVVAGFGGGHDRPRSRRGSRGTARLAPRDRSGHTDRSAAAEPTRIDIRSTAKERTKQGNLFVRR
jgi:cytosine/adenosine deaminase-related metal-dependent hydrolase